MADAPKTCDLCGRPAWSPNGGMGGGLMPDCETHCLKREGHLCRTASAARKPVLDMLARIVGHLEHQARQGDGIDDDAWEDYQAAREMLGRGRTPEVDRG